MTCQHGSVTASIPLTVIGGYLGAGKTTLINHLLRHADGRRIAVIVNDFGSLAIDADLLVGADETGDVISLANGCVCCTVGTGLHDALSSLTARAAAPDHVVIEVSGVADPAVAAAWGTVAPFEPGGVIVLADATAVVRMSRDRYVGTEIHRQLVGADLVVVTKTDLCEPDRLAVVLAWIDEATDGATRIEVVDGRIPSAVVLGIRDVAVEPRRATTGDADDPDDHDHDHADRYVSWSWASAEPIPAEQLDAFTTSLRADILRVKGFVRLADGRDVVVQCVGRRVDIRPSVRPVTTSQLVAIGLRTDPPSPSPFASPFG